jgi:hypothetical protein
MPVATGNNALTRPEQFVDHFYNDLLSNAEALGVAYVGSYDERLIPQYPAVVVSPGPVEKELHATHTFLYTNRTFFYVMHALLSVDHRVRNQEDLELASRLSDFIERDKVLTDPETNLGRIVFGFVESEVPGVLTPRSNKGDAVVGTRLHYRAISEGRF